MVHQLQHRHADAAHDFERAARTAPWLGTPRENIIGLGRNARLRRRIALLMTEFTDSKVLRWRDAIEPFLLKPELAEGFDAIERIQALIVIPSSDAAPWPDHAPSHASDPRGNGGRRW